MVSPEQSQFQPPSLMAKYTTRTKQTSFLTDGFLFLTGAMAALLVVWAVWSFADPNSNSVSNFTTTFSKPKSPFPTADDCAQFTKGPNLHYDPPDPTFYDDPGLKYTVGDKIQNWDEKRKVWMNHHPSFSENRVLIVTGSQTGPCKNPIGDHLLLRFFKNKVDYSRIHGHDIFYNNLLLHPKMTSYWAKIPAVKAAMVAHPEAEWIWWIDSDAAFTDMEFKLPLDRYKNHNFVVHGWPHLIYDRKSWTSLNAGVFLIRNCQWSMDFLEVWASMGPQTKNFNKWGEILRSTLPDKLFPESDDQSGLIYLMLKEKEKWADKVYLEGAYYLEGYWLEIVGNLGNVSEKYDVIEKGWRRLRRRHGEKVSLSYSALRERYLKDAGNGKGSWRRPFITHFTGCQPCSGDHNQMYAGGTCWDAMIKALNFGDNQVLRSYGYVHRDLLDSASVSPLPFDYPAD